MYKIYVYNIFNSNDSLYYNCPDKPYSFISNHGKSKEVNSILMKGDDSCLLDTPWQWVFCAFGKNHDIAMSMLVSWEHAKGKQQNNIQEFRIPFCKSYCINWTSLLSTSIYSISRKKGTTFWSFNCKIWNTYYSKHI